MTDQELKPCPFCGGPPRHYINRASDFPQGFSPNTWISCQNCGAESNVDTDTNEVIDSWQRRTCSGCANLQSKLDQAIKDIDLLKERLARCER
jgi:Lar family restriction alleviation protein